MNPWGSAQRELTTRVLISTIAGLIAALLIVVVIFAMSEDAEASGPSGSEKINRALSTCQAVEAAPMGVYWDEELEYLGIEATRDNGFRELGCVNEIIDLPDEVARSLDDPFDKGYYEVPGEFIYTWYVDPQVIFLEIAESLPRG